MTISESDRRALKILAVTLAVSVPYFVYQLMPASTVSTPSTAATESVDMAEQRLARLRDIAASSSAKQDILKRVSGELAQREAGLVRAETGQQAEAQIVTRVREVQGNLVGIAADGGMGGFSAPGGVATKRKMLEIEGVEGVQAAPRLF